MDFALSEEQQLIVATTRAFVRQELVPHEREIEESGVLREELRQQLKAKALAAGLYAANMPTDVGGGGLDSVSWVLYEKELGYTGYALQYGCVGRPSGCTKVALYFFTKPERRIFGIIPRRSSGPKVKGISDSPMW